jgi:hypothetical protein
MKKFSITRLEEARKNPNMFAKSLLIPNTNSGFFGRAKFLRWQDSVNHFHKTNDPVKAFDYIEQSFSRYSNTSRNRKEYNFYVDSLDEYIKQFRGKGYIYLKSESLKMSLNSKTMITGRVPLTFMNIKNGFSLYFFSKSSLDLDNELRFPIIQDHFAEKIYGTESSNIEVGIFCNQNNQFISKVFNSKEIKNAKDELKKIGDTIYKIL